MVFHGFRLVFHGSRPVFMVFMVPGWFSWFFHCSRLVIHGSRLVFHGSRLVFHGFSPEFTRPKLYPGPTIQSRSAARRAA